MSSGRQHRWLWTLCLSLAATDSGTEGFVALSTRPTRLSTSRPALFIFASIPNEDTGSPQQQQQGGNPFFRWLAELSLEDYQWRSNRFKNDRAERMVEESMARMMGENATYVRPMDAAFLGPLGRWEKESVAWLQQVIDEEGRRARRIVESAGKLIRPSDNIENEKLGPLGFLELKVLEFFASIRRAESERVRTKTLRPMDLDENFRGPLGQLELEAVKIFEDIRNSEELRAQLQSRSRDGAIVRPIDVPGPLGELEMNVAELFRAEVRRATKERERNGGQLVRPKDATLRGPLGEAEMNAFQTIQSLSREEMERLRNIRRVLEENRPMETNRKSLLGVAESLLVGILRAPRLIQEVITRVQELLQSDGLDEKDKEIMRRGQEENMK